MKDAAFLLTLVLLLILPTACTEDEAVESMFSASQTENILKLDKDLELDWGLALKLELGLDPSIDLKAPELKERVNELRDSINTYVASEYSLMHHIGRQILRERGVDPDTAFSGGPGDPRLALIPVAAEILDKLNERFLRHGYTIVELYGPEDSAKVAARTPTGEGTHGPWDYYWETFGGGSDAGWFVHKEEEIHDCVAEVLSEVGGMVVFAAGSAKAVGVVGKALISFVGGATVITVGGGLTLAGVMYGAYRMGKCLEEQDRISGETCSLTVALDTYCKGVLKEDSGYSESSKASCRYILRDLLMKKIRGIEIRVDKDTLALVASPKFYPDWRDIIRRRNEGYGK